MDSLSGCTILTHFADLPDPRIDRAKRHDLLAIVTIARCAVICGADSWVEIERFGRAKRAWVETFPSLPHGIPSHNTFGRVFAALDPAALEQCFLGWVQALVTTMDGAVVAIDSKALRRSHDHAHDRDALHLVSAWATANHVVLGQVATDAHANEITAIPVLLEMLVLDDATITLDAMGCQTAIATLPDPGQTSCRTVGKEHGRLDRASSNKRSGTLPRWTILLLTDYREIKHTSQFCGRLF